MRIISFLPSATEIVAAIGHAHELVGVSHECDYPPPVRAREVVTSTAIDAAGPPGDIDTAVHELLESGRPLYDIREDRIRALAPDVVVTQAVCEVCAVREGDVRALAASMHPAPAVVALGATTLDGILDDIRRVGDAIGDAAGTERLIGAMRERMRRVHTTLREARAPRPRVAVIEWTDPVFAAGHWVPEMVYRAGGADVLAEPGEPSSTRTIAAVRGSDPEVLVLAPCGYHLERAAEEGARLLASPKWAWARGRRVWAIDASSLTSRPGPRVADGIEVLARLFHPDLFAPVDPQLARPIEAR